MANTIEVTNSSPARFVAGASRYMQSTVLLYSEEKYLTFETYKRSERKVSNSDKYMVVSKGHEYRPDLVSRRAYGTPDYWWQILEANGMKDIWEFKSGVNIRIPSNIL